MTYKELYDRANYLADNNKITLGEYERMIEPLNNNIAVAGRYCRYKGTSCEFATEYGYCSFTVCIKRWR